jgi:hypothetical protein
MDWRQVHLDAGVLDLLRTGALGLKM